MDTKLFKEAITTFQKKQSHNTPLTIGNLYEILQHYEDLLEKKEIQENKIHDDFINNHS